MKFEISQELNDALEKLIKSLSIEVGNQLWDAWRHVSHRQQIEPAQPEEPPVSPPAA